MAARNAGAPQVIAYWLTSASIAALAAPFSSTGQEKSGNPWARLTAPCTTASRVMSLITDSVKVDAFADTRAAAGIRPGAGTADCEGSIWEATAPSCSVSHLSGGHGPRRPRRGPPPPGS